MTTRPPAPPDLASVASVLEELLKPGHQLVHNRRSWMVQRWDSFTDRDGPRMGWVMIDHSTDLSVLLARLREGPREQP